MSKPLRTVTVADLVAEANLIKRPDHRGQQHLRLIGSSQIVVPLAHFAEVLCVVHDVHDLLVVVAVTVEKTQHGSLGQSAGQLDAAVDVEFAHA